jgi:hypothetical protein
LRRAFDESEEREMSASRGERKRFEAIAGAGNGLGADIALLLAAKDYRAFGKDGDVAGVP